MEDERVIAKERGKQLADQLGLEFFETSAKDNINVKQVFERYVLLSPTTNYLQLFCCYVPVNLNEFNKTFLKVTRLKG